VQLTWEQVRLETVPTWWQSTTRHSKGFLGFVFLNLKSVDRRTCVAGTTKTIAFIDKPLHKSRHKASTET
jgi:hypothetical protein